MRWPVPALMVAAIFFPAFANANDLPRKFTAEYRMTWLGIKVASLRFDSAFDGSGYRIDGHVETAGAARLFDRTKGTAAVSGRLGKQSLVPQDYRLRYVHDSKQKSTSIRYRQGQVASTQNQPPLKPRGKNYVPLEARHLAGALDPISAIVIRAASPGEVCRRAIRVYDGEIRFDLRLSPAGTRPFNIRGFKGEGVNCRASFSPVAGYRKGRKALNFLQQKSRIEIAFAPLADSGLYAPIAATVGTEVGPVRLAATRFSVSD